MELSRAAQSCPERYPAPPADLHEGASSALRPVTTFSAAVMRSEAWDQADLFEYAPVPLLVVDRNLCIKRCNRRAVALLAECVPAERLGLAEFASPSVVHWGSRSIADGVPTHGQCSQRTCGLGDGTKGGRVDCRLQGRPLSAFIAEGFEDSLGADLSLPLAPQAGLMGHVCALRGIDGQLHWMELALSRCESTPPTSGEAAFLLSMRSSSADKQAPPRPQAEEGESSVLARRLMAMATEPFALVTRSHVLSANGAFCRRAGIVLGAANPLPLSTLFGAEDQVLLFDVECYDACEEDGPAWLDVEFAGPQTRRMQARALRLEGGRERRYLLCLSESERFEANEQALRRLESWAVAGLSAAPETLRPPALPSRRRTLHPAARLGQVLVAAAAHHMEAPMGALDGPLPHLEHDFVNVSQVVMRAVGVGGTLGNCRIVCRMQPSPAIALDEGQLLLAVRCLLEHAVQPLCESDMRSMPTEVIVRTESDARGIQIWVEPQFTRKISGEHRLPRHTDSGALLLSQRAIHAAGGWLQVDSLSGGGLRYGLLLPLCTVGDGMLAEVVDARESRRVAPSSLRVLVVDSDRKVAALLRRGLRQGCQLEAVERGRDAIALLTLDGHFDVILCDVRMADEGGVQVFRWLSTYRPSLLPRLLLMTDGACGDVTPVGVPVVHKPLDATALLQVVCSLAGSAASAGGERRQEVAAS